MQLLVGPVEPPVRKEARPSEQQEAALWVQLEGQPSAGPAVWDVQPVAELSARPLEERLSAALPSAVLLAEPWVLASGQVALLAQR
ncbi:hypothetical protein ASC80_19310 [Afipia sp. Root123D2]|uniref:hypothetical protein n=1 Tax=Afipia sp. Root123D2 TaxID=1736436 RepID=UPI0006F4AFD1|nr:hypothetical protein ASC80_19310 [Afipia sp. Root123D2]